jgi:hypothetical protein
MLILIAPFFRYGARTGIAELSDDQLAATIAATEGRIATYLREVVQAGRPDRSRAAQRRTPTGRRRNAGRGCH